MTNTTLLEEKIKQSGLKKGYLADRIGVSRSTFYAQVRNGVEFRVSQVKILCSLLGIKDPETMQAIFFSPDGACKATKEETA